ncbi:MAG: T9SS type A sorting domain-containing protein [bacterium]|nr:T9SS type A sorting domain-containing protein [bacterium]
MNFKNQSLILSFVILAGFQNLNGQTSWKGTTSTSWGTSSNWTSGVPTSTIDAIIGNASFTGSFQPTLTATSSCKNLTIGGTVTSTLTIARNITVSGNITINSNGTILANSSNRTITVKGNWTNSGTYNATVTSTKVTFSGVAPTLTGATTFQRLTINSGSTLTLANNISVGNALTVSGTINPTASYTISGAGSVTVNSTGILYVYASTYAGNYSISGTKSFNGTSTVNYASAVTAQTVSNSITYGILRISGGSTKSLSANLPNLSSSSTAAGKIYIDAGIFNLLNFTANRASAGGAFAIAAGATLKIGGTNSFPSNFSTITLATTSTVEYNGTAQTVLATNYGNLSFSSSSGSATKTMPSTALIIAGDFTSSIGSGTSVLYTASQNITVNGNTTIGASCTFNGSSFNHAFGSNWTNNGTFTGSSSTATFTGISSNLSGTGSNNFFNLSFIASGITANGSTNLNILGNLNTTAPGVFTHNAGGNVTMSGASKTITGNGLEFANLIITGSITSTANLIIFGNLTNNGTFSASAGTTTLSGSSNSINGSAACTFYALSIEGNISTAVNFNILSSISISLTGSFIATAGNANFNGISTFSGTANLYDVTISASKTLILGTSSVLGISNSFTKTGSFDVTSFIPNTVQYNGSINQTIINTTYNNLVLSNGGTKTPNGTVTVNNDFTIQSGVTFNASSYIFSLYRHWNNYGTFVPSTSDIQLRGINAATITGATTFNTFTVNKSSSAIKTTLSNNIIAASIVMTNGNMATLNNSVTTTGSRTGNGIILGTIIHSHTFTNGTAYSFEGPNNLITFTSPSGIGSVTVTTKIGEIVDFDPSIESLIREYAITVNSGTYTNAKLRFHYENNELNAFSEPFLAIYKYNSGILWDSVGFSARDTALNYVEQSGITNLSGRFTCSGTRNVVRWNGSVSTDWNTATNWTTVSGSSMANRVPNSTDAAYLGSATFSNQPTVSTTNLVSVLRFGSAQACTLTISSGSLGTLGSTRGNWTTNRSHVIDVTGGTLEVGTQLVLSDSISGHDIALKIGSGTVNIFDDLDQKMTGSITFTSSGSLNISGNYIHTGGNFSPGAGTVTYLGGDAQAIAAVGYNNLVFNKTTERASFTKPTTVAGNFTINGAGEVAIYDTLSVAGNITINASTYLYNENAFINIGGNWQRNGSYISSNGSIQFNGTGSQSANSSTFSNMVVNKASGTLTLIDNITIDNSLTLQSGTLNLDTFFINRSSDGGTFSINAGATLRISGNNNFPDHYITNSLDSSSNVVYNGAIAQTIRKVTYGNLTFSNGGSNAKMMIGNIRINGDLLINSGATFNPDINSINLYGNLTNNGTFSPGSSTLNLNGTSKTITGSITVNNLSVVTGSYTVSTGTVSMSGNLYIESTGSLNFANNTAILDGDLTNKGTLTSNGTATFTGNRVQTFQLLNSITSASTGIVNFNGTVSPVINSNSSPAFATVNINNTGGITASVPWFVYFALNVSSGATFNGGPLTHTFYGNFTNNGTVLSNGKLKFAPGAPYSSSGAVKLDGTLFSSSGEVEFGGTAALTITNSNPGLNIVTISNTHSSGVTPPSSWTILDELNIAAGATFNAGTSTNHLISGSFTNNGTLNGQTSTIRFDGNPVEISGIGSTTFNNIKIESAADLALTSSININQNLIVDGLFDANAGTIIFTGTTASAISGSASGVALGDIEQSKTGANTTLSIPISVFGDMTLTSGNIVSSTTNLLTIEDDATSTAGNANSYVIGPIKKVGNDSFVFPLGKGSKWARLGIGAPANATDAFTAQYFNINYSDTLTMAGSPAPVLNNVSSREYWTCDRTTGTSNVKVHLFWETKLSGVNAYTSDLVVARWNGSGWENKGQSAITGGTPGNVTSNTVTSFSPFTFGSLSSSMNPLPITLLSFDGEINNKNEVELKWETVNEINNAYFTIEKSIDGINFELVTTIKGAGNSIDIISYQTLDYNPYKGISYYRLKQTDFNGLSQYAPKTIYINFNSKSSTMAIYPNPTNGRVNIDLNSKTEGIITIKNTLGKIIFSESFIDNKMAFDLTDYEKGIYFVTLETKNTSNCIKIIKM